MNRFEALVKTTLAVEKLRVAAQVRRSHLARRKQKDPDTVEMIRRLEDLEHWVDGRIGELLKEHPAYGWFSRVKGIGPENIAKVLGLIRVAPEVNDEGEELPYADTISALWKFSGYSVEDGRAPKRVPGQKLPYNAQLRTLCWRVATSLMKAGVRERCTKCGQLIGQTKRKTHECPDPTFVAIATTKFGAYYLKQKVAYQQRYEKAGVRIVPAEELPKKGGKRYEPEGIISEGHVHNQALRKTIKLFLACLWLSWREAEGLPLSEPYAIGIMGHSTVIRPSEMCDKPAAKAKRARKSK